MFLHLLWQILHSLSLQCTIYICSILNHRKVKTGYHQDSVILISVPITSDLYFEILPPTISIIWDINRGWLRSKKPTYKRYHICSTVFDFIYNINTEHSLQNRLRKLTRGSFFYLFLKLVQINLYVRIFCLSCNIQKVLKNGQIIW